MLAICNSNKNLLILQIRQVRFLKSPGLPSGLVAADKVGKPASSELKSLLDSAKIIYLFTLLYLWLALG